MKIKEVISVYGERKTVDLDTAKIYTYSNSNKTITYTAQEVEEGKHTEFWTEYKEEGIVTDIEARINVFGSKLSNIYAELVDYQKSKNDSNGAVWNTFVEYVKENESTFFDENGDYRNDFFMTDEDIKMFATTLYSLIEGEDE